MIEVRRFIGYVVTVTVLMMRSSEHLAALKQQLTDVNVSVHFSSDDGRLMKVEYVHYVISFIELFRY
jgi:hypothetical protein